MIKAVETEDDLIIPHITNLSPLIDNLLAPNSSMTNNDIETNNSPALAPVGPVVPPAEPSPASPILIDSTAGESPNLGDDSPSAAGGLGSPHSTSLSPIDYYGSNARPQHCSSIPRPELAELGVLCAAIHQYRTRHGDTPPAMVQPGIFHDVNSVGTLQYIRTLGRGEDPLLFNYPAWRAALHSIDELLTPYLHSTFSPTASPIRPDSPTLPVPEPTFRRVNTPHPAGALLARIGDVPFIPRPPSSLNDSDQENRPDDPALEDWMEYDPLDPSHYSVQYTDDFGHSQTCPYIRYVQIDGIPTLQGCVHPRQGIYGRTLHAQAHPDPIPTIDGPHDMRFEMFNPTIRQQLLVDTALASLDDIGATAEVARYRAAFLELRDAERDQCRAEAAVQ
jgi:hypothetical protein